METAPIDARFPLMNQTQHCYTHYLEYHKWVTLYSFLSMIIICFSHKQFHRLVWNDTSSSNLRLIKSRNKNISNQKKKKRKKKKKKKDRNPNNLFNIDKAKLKTKKIIDVLCWLGAFRRKVNMHLSVRSLQTIIDRCVLLNG